MRRLRALAKDDHVNSDEMPIDDDEFGRDLEYGDQEFLARDSDRSDHSMHLFLAARGGRGGITSPDDEDQVFGMRRSAALAKEDVFGSSVHGRSTEESAILYESLSND